EYLPNETFTHGLDPYKYSNAGNSWLYRINDTGGVVEVPSNAFTVDYSNAHATCSKRAWNMSFSGVDNVMMATVHRGETGCSCSAETCTAPKSSFKTTWLTEASSCDPTVDPVSSPTNPCKTRDRSGSPGRRLGTAMFIKSQGSPDTFLPRRYYYNGRT